jgi:hypothetical protein
MQNSTLLKFSTYQGTNYTGYKTSLYNLNLLAPELFFLILAHFVYKMWIIQEPNTLELWNKLRFEEEKTESIYHV